MTKLTKVALLIALIAAGTHLLTVSLVPIVIMQRAMSMISGGDRINVALPAPRADAKNQRVVRSSPELLYTVCVFDVSESALHVSGSAQDAYVSLSGFAANTDNFFVINERQLQRQADGSRQFNVVIRGSKSENNQWPPGAQVIDAPTDRGILLFRSLLPTEDSLDTIDKFRTQQTCVPIA